LHDGYKASVAGVGRFAAAWEEGTALQTLGAACTKRFKTNAAIACRYKLSVAPALGVVQHVWSYNIQEV
jgi:hypothetical protein